MNYCVKSLVAKSVDCENDIAEIILLDKDNKILYVYVIRSMTDDVCDHFIVTDMRVTIDKFNNIVCNGDVIEEYGCFEETIKSSFSEFFRKAYYKIFELNKRLFPGELANLDKFRIIYGENYETYNSILISVEYVTNSFGEWKELKISDIYGVEYYFLYGQDDDGNKYIAITNDSYIFKIDKLIGKNESFTDIFGAEQAIVTAFLESDCPTPASFFNTKYEFPFYIATHYFDKSFEGKKLIDVVWENINLSD